MADRFTNLRQLVAAEIASVETRATTINAAVVSIRTMNNGLPAVINNFKAVQDKVKAALAADPTNKAWQQLAADMEQARLENVAVGQKIEQAATAVAPISVE